MGNLGREISIREPLNILFKRKNVLISFFLAVVLTVGIGSFLITPEYEAKAQVLVRVGHDNILVSSMGERYPFVNFEQEQIINSEVEILKSKALSETVIRTLGGPIAIFPGLKSADSENSFKHLLQSLLPFSEKQVPPAEIAEKELYTALEMFHKALTIDGIKKSNAIFIYFRHENPKMAAIVANKLAEAYIEYHLNMPKSEKSYEFFKNQTSMIKSQLSETEKKLEDLKSAYKISNLDEQKSLQIRQKSDLRVALGRALSEEVETRNRISMLKQQLGATPQNIPQRSEVDSNMPLMSTLQTRLVELELREKDLRSKYTDDSRLVKSVEEEIRVVRQRIAEQQGLQFSRNTSGTNPTFQHLQQELMRQDSEWRAIQAKVDAIKNQLKVCESELLTMDQVEPGFKELERKADLERKNYALYVAKLEESRISGAMSSEKISNVTLVETAYAPLVPKSPKRKINILFGIAIGLFGGVGLAFLAERINGKADSPEQIERILKVPVLTSIPEIPNPS